ncbi:hypothetical protein JTB14_004647 [Gonioctena quinquepunctata]|nr:hypothetical protein JTB14_004647 [Gonioctena quinquepunctata]
MGLDAAWNKNKADDMSVSILKMALPRVLCRARPLLNNDISVVSKYSSLVNSVSIKRCVHIRTVRFFRTHFSAGAELYPNKGTEKSSLSSSSSSSTSSSDSESDSDSDLEDGVYSFDGMDTIK